MSKKPYGISAYETAQRTVPQIQAVVMLYDGMIRRIRGAALAAREGDLKLQIEETMHAIRIIEGLNRSLDMEKGGKVAEGLRDTYWSTGATLSRCIGSPDAAAACDKLAEAMSVLRDSWAEIAGVPLIRADVAAKEASGDEAR
ncbi:MAG: flagellar export chaperone FliS [Rhodospirillaceae bacterium]|nr:flagellar export chaperone FliS [Rhodospirillaceae bacterium]MEA4837745.1 flagellar export chaperone FliS [Rhodospirillaceae bacterium]